MKDVPLISRPCLACGATVKGRADKKFCNDYCRNNYNNQQKAKGNQSSLVRNINNALLKNRVILESFLPEGMDTAKTSRDKLLQAGFSFKYFTQSYTTKTGNVYHYCYDFGYRHLENDWLLIVKNKED